MSDEISTVDQAEDGLTDEQAAEGFAKLMQSLFGQPEPSQAIIDRFETLAPTVNEAFTRLGVEGEGGSPDGYDVHLTSKQLRWVLSALGYFVRDEVPDDAHGAATTLLDVSEVLLAAVA